MPKAPRNKSLAWSILASGSVAVFGYQLFRFFGAQIVPVDVSSLLQFGGYAAFGAAGIMVAHDKISALPERKFRVTCENTGLYIDRESGIRLPHLREKQRARWGWRLWYKLPNGLAVKQFEEKREQFEASLNAEISFAWRYGLIRVDVLPGEIPNLVEFEEEEVKGLDGEIPFTVGQGREGLLTADLATCPHLLVAGQTGAGKSNFLHQLIASLLLNREIVMHIIDLKRVEFAYLKKQVSVKYNMQGAIDTLEFLTAEMHRRMAFLEKEGYVNAKEWRQANPQRAKELPYHVLVVDEFSQLCPVLAKEKADREARTYTHKLLVDLICLARSLGIHCVIATQRPDKDILPGQLKANIPATVCFKVRSRVNSQICLDNERATELPSPKELPGRAIWQFETEREVQTMHLPLERARGAAHNYISSSFSPIVSSSLHTPGRFNVE